jgi:hypothetical protein
MRAVLTCLLIGAAALPLAIIVTFLSSPFWGWIETKTGIESLGHSGPAEWCFIAVYSVIFVVGIAGWLSRSKKSDHA